MLDWKILAASFAALLVVSSTLMGGFGIGDTFSGFTDKISQWLGGSSASLSTTGTQEVEIKIKPNILIIPIEIPSSVEISPVIFKNFKGNVIADYENKILTFTGPEEMEATSILQKTIIKETGFNKIILEDIEVEIIHDDWSEKTDKSKVEVIGFTGDITITEDGITLKGTVSNIEKNNI
ncbi:MAG: hypothetical protein ABIH52_04455 [Candidatus Aenigmatarchaeota archaeon]